MRRKILKRNIIILGLFFILSTIGSFSYFGNLFNYVGRSIWKTEKIINDSLYNFNYLFRTKAAITNENHKLIEEISNIRLTMADYQLLKKEVNGLKEILGRLPGQNNFILGNILTKPNHSPYDTIVIDIGKDMEIKELDKVYANGNIPVGIISKIYNKTSLVTLYTSPGQKTEGFLDITNASVELIGRGGGNFEMIIPMELFAEKGTIIYLPGNSPEVLAIIDEIISAPTDPFKKVLLSSPVNVQNLKWVQIKKD